MADGEFRILSIFPGQGSHYVGMGADLCAASDVARRTYDTASQVLGYDVFELSVRDPEEQLFKTEFAQAALLTHSIACFEMLRDKTDGRFAPQMFAGHSLGEYSALVAGGALSFEAALRLVQRRGELMGSLGRGEMFAVRLDLETVRPIAERYYCSVGGCNYPEQTVVGGSTDDLVRFVDDVVEHHPKAHPVHLKTDGAFHTYLMVDAAEHLRPAIEEAEIHAPTGRVLSNHTGGFHGPSPEGIKASLFFQVFSPVRWDTNLRTALEAGVDLIVECGGGIGTGKDPQDKRPNLEGVTRRAMKNLTEQAPYLPAINESTIEATSHFVKAWSIAVREPSDALSPQSQHVADKWFHLFVPTESGHALDSAVELVALIDELDLGRIVQIVREPVRENEEHLASLVGEVTAPQPYLEVIVGGESGAVLFSVAEDAKRELRELSAGLGGH